MCCSTFWIFFSELEGELADDEKEVEFGSEDLPDAYRCCPVSEVEHAASIVAVWSPEALRWVFFRLLALVYGIGSAVVSFNRLPTLLTAVHRRVFWGRHKGHISTTSRFWT